MQDATTRLCDHWAQVVREQYNMDASLERLDGEFDLNFAVLSEGTRTHVLKVMREDCSRDLVELQCFALDHIAANSKELAVPKVAKTSSGELYCLATDETGVQRLVWLITMLSGKLYAHARPQTHELVGEIGETLAKTHLALNSFKHSALVRDLKWDLGKSLWARNYISLIEEAERRNIVDQIFADFELLLPTYQALAVRPVHNDCNDYNILTSVNGSGAVTISGLIDFGDLILAPAVAEVAIAGAYAILGQERPIAALASLVAGYHRILPFAAEEIAMIYPLVLTRLAVSVVNAAIAKREKPDDPYV
ncbi:MAG: phosphotransferase, partial [Rhizobiaceae bacterium]